VRYRWFEALGVRTTDLYLILCHIAEDADLQCPLTIRIGPDGLDLTQYSSVRRQFGGTSVYAAGARVQLQLCRSSWLDGVHTVVLRHARDLQRKNGVSVPIRRALAQISYSFIAQQEFYREATILMCHRAYRAALRYGNQKRADRSKQIVRICRRKFGLHPSLRFTVRLPTPHGYTRQQVRRLVAQRIVAHSPVDLITRHTIVRLMRVVFTAPNTVLRLLDNVRAHVRTYEPGQPRACTCQRFPAPGGWRAPDTN
jgi:hypothetical protein